MNTHENNGFGESRQKASPTPNNRGPAASIGVRDSLPKSLFSPTKQEVIIKM
jgi:hypothetical protein